METEISSRFLTISPEVLLIKEFDDIVVRYRYYSPRDSPAVIALGDEASKSNKLFGLYCTGPIYRDTFEIKAKNFTDSTIIVAETNSKCDKASFSISGVACVGIKDMYFSGELCKAGMLYGLRVGIHYQGKGIGNTLCDLIEQVSISRGVEFLYLCVKTKNIKAVSLYTKLGYEIISKRRVLPFELPAQKNEIAPSRKIIFNNGREVELLFERLTREETIKYYTSFYKGQDLSLTSFGEMTDAPAYAGTYAVRTSDNQNIAGMTLYKIRKNGFLGLKKLGVDVSHYNNAWLIGFIISFCVMIVSWPLQAIKNWILEGMEEKSCVWLFGILLIMTPLWLMTTGYINLNKRITKSGGYAVRGRCVSPFFIADNKQIEGEMWKFLSEQIGVVAANEDFSKCVYNCDSNDEFASKIPGINLNGSAAQFMGRRLTQGTALKGYKPTKYVFFDSRDL
jgi:hypothetical protein